MPKAHRPLALTSERHHHFVHVVGQKSHVAIEKARVHAAWVLAPRAAETKPWIPGSFDAES